MLVVTRLRVPQDSTPEEFRAALEAALLILAGCRGYRDGDVGRNVDDPDLWVLCTRWEDVGSYRRAIGSYQGKMHIQPMMATALDEPSAYEVAEPDGKLNTVVPRASD